MDTLHLLFSEEQIKERIKVLGKEITEIYNGEQLVVICILKGAVLFFSDIIRCIDCPLEIDFIRLTSYGNKSETSKIVTFTKDIEISLTDKHVLIVEDIVDTGHTMEFLLHQLAARGAKSLRIVTLINKNERREKSINVDFTGFHVSSGFLVGYGLDHSEKYRELSDIYELQISQ